VMKNKLASIITIVNSFNPIPSVASFSNLSFRWHV
jgi:hypothetical protein